MRVLALLVLVGPAVAHAELEQKGLRIGGAVMSISGGDMGPSGGPQEDSVFPQPGGMVGTFLTFRRSDNFAIQIEAGLVNNNLRAENCSNGCMTTADITLYYLEAPFLLRLDLLPGATKFHLDLGAELALTLGGGATPPGGAFERFDDLSPFNFGPVGGVGLEFPAGPGKIAIDFRYKRWIAPLTSSDGEASIQSRSSHQVVIGVGYAFP
jgi:hypothetical protein